MSYIRGYLRMHIKYWWLYLSTIPIMLLSFVIGILLMLHSAFTDRNVKIAENLARIGFSIMSSLPLVIPNYKASIEAAKEYNMLWYLCFILNQSVSIIIYYIAYKVFVLMW